LLTEELEFRTCPRTFVFSLTREGEGCTLSLSLNLDRPGGELILLEDLEKWRRKGLDVLQARFPAVAKEPQALALLGQTLKAMRWQANPGSGCVRTQVHVSGPAGRALLTLVKQVYQLPEDGQQEQ